MNEYPEHEKLKKVVDQSQAVGEFVEWLEDQGMMIAEYLKCIDIDDHGKMGHRCRESRHLYPATPSLNDLLGNFFEIDGKKLEQEKREMLESLK